MATKGHIAFIRETAIAELIETGRAAAALFDIDPPKLDFHYRDSDYLQAEQLRVIAAFNQQVYAAAVRLMAPEPGEKVRGDETTPPKTELPAGKNKSGKK